MKFGKREIDDAYLEKSVVPRLAANFARDGDCVIWTGALDRKGYGRICLVTTDGGRVHTRAHRIVAAMDNGGLSEDDTVDHICCRRACCNQAHLQLVTGRENTRLRDRRRYEARHVDQLKLPWG